MGGEMKSVGQVAYESWRETWMELAGDHMFANSEAEWSALADNLQASWEAGGEAVRALGVGEGHAMGYADGESAGYLAGYNKGYDDGENNR